MSAAFFNSFTDTTARQRSAGGIAVIGLHALAAAGVAMLAVRQTPPDEAPVLTVQWLPTPVTAPEQKPQPARVEKPRPATPAQTPVPPKADTHPVEAPQVLQAAPAEESVTRTAPKVDTQVAPAPAPAPVQQAAPAPTPAAAPSEPQMLRPDVDCVRSPAPEYPAASRRLGEEGHILLRMQVDDKGIPLQVEVVNGSGYARLDRAAREAIRQTWQCPLKRNGQAVTGWFRVPINFELN